MIVILVYVNDYFDLRSAVEAWMVEPRRGVKHNILFPKNPEKW